MGLKLNMNAMNQIVKGVPIWEENETITSVCLVLKGRILVQREGMQTILGTGNFLGICDLYSGSSSVTYTAYDNAVIYPFSVRSPGDIETIIHKNKEYGGLMVASLSRYIRELRGIVEELSNEARDLCIFLQDYYERYQIQAKKVDFNVPELKELSVMEDYEMSELLDMRKAEYYSECAGVPIEVQKEFYQNETICVYHIEEQTELARQLILECTEIYQFLKATAKKLYDKGEYCLFKQVARCIITLNAKNKNPDKELIDSIDRMVEKLNTLDLLLEKKTGRTLDIDRDELENLYYMILSGEVPEEIATSVKEKVVMLHDSMDKIFQAGSFTGEKKEAFLQLFSQYKSMVDKNAVDDASRRLRKELSVLYYELYKQVFLASFQKKENILAVELFLKYGLLDETLLREDQLEELVELEEIKGKGFIKIYNMKEWLTLIYLGKELPSKSEFDMDYEEYIRSLKKANEITDEEAVLRFQDKTSRLEYEISNLFQYNNRLIHGQIITFVPFLQESSFVTQIGKSFITNERVEEAIKAIRAIDYSLFYREEAYDNESLEIRREYVVKEIFPDIILFPVSGENGIMWQEVSGRKRNSKGRILLPSFSMGNLRDILIKVFGRYRWELCRTMQGSAWNNIKYKSLTSEYMDYIQFYRKNRDLSEDKKERLKAQIQKSRNNSKEVFVMDYEIWISFESKGAIRLNKVVREMLATYCPLSREIRDKQREQPLFADAMSRFQMQRANKVRALELLVHSLEKNGKDVPSEIQNTLLYYKEA